MSEAGLFPACSFPSPNYWKAAGCSFNLILCLSWSRQSKSYLKELFTFSKREKNGVRVAYDMRKLFKQSPKNTYLAKVLGGEANEERFPYFLQSPDWVPVIKHRHITGKIKSTFNPNKWNDLLEFLLRDLNGPIFHSSSLLWPGQISRLHRRGLHTAFRVAGPPVREWIQIHGLPIWSDQDATFHLLS